MGWICIKNDEFYIKVRVDSVEWISHQVFWLTGCIFSRLPQFPSFPPPSMGTGQWWEIEGSGEGAYLEATWSVWFLDILSLRWLRNSPINLFLYFVRKTVKHIHFSIIHFLDHPRQFKILVWHPCNAVHFGSSTSCFLNMQAQEC